MDNAAQQTIRETIAAIGRAERERATELAARLVYDTAKDLQGNRPIEETRDLMARLYDAFIDLLDNDAHKLLREFIEYVVEYRATREFHLSTLIRGFLAPRNALAQVIEETTADLQLKAAALTELQRLYEPVIFEVSDKYQEVVTRTLRQRAAELQRSNQALEEFAYVVSHDLQEPVRKIITFSEILGDALPPPQAEDGEVADCLRRITSAGHRMRGLIEDLLTLSRVTTRGKALAGVDLNEIYTQALDDLEVPILETGGKVESGSLPEVHGDATQLLQLMVNLIGNSLKYTKPGMTPEVRVEGGMSDGHAFFSVQDKGIGFAPEHAKRIFGAFQRLHSRQVYDGTGIGLAICQRIAERHGGSISAEAEVGRGARFTVTLPAPRADGDVGDPTGGDSDE